MVRVVRSAGSAAEFHGWDLVAERDAVPGQPVDEPVDVPVVWEFVIDRPAVVLGSRQRDDVLDLDACRAAGVEVAHRRSGGGIVHLVPDEVVWVDVVLGPDDPRWVADVRASMQWMGERWVEALVSTEPDLAADRLVVHRGGLESTSWSDLLCFAGIGPGEVLLDGRKLVGISQRRTRHGARFQCAVHLTHDPFTLLPLLAGTLPPLDELPPVGVLPMLRTDLLVPAIGTAIGASNGA